MTPPVFPLRCERKFLAPGWPLPEVLAWVRRHPALFREAYPARAVNNLYLDTASRRHYHDHVQGLAHRIKTRVRWYGPLRGCIARPALELKIKRGLVNGKVAHPLGPLTLNGGVDPNTLEARWREANLPAPLAVAMRALEPTLVNRYQRRYFISADGRFRLTVDTELQFFGRGTGHALSQAPRTVAPGIILELKYDPRCGEQAATLTQSLPFRLTRCSKYVLGIEQGL